MGIVNIQNRVSPSAGWNGTFQEGIYLNRCFIFKATIPEQEMEHKELENHSYREHHGRQKGNMGANREELLG